MAIELITRRVAATIEAIKCDYLAEAESKTISVDNDAGAVTELVPVGAWILSDPALVEELSLWRSRAMRFFFSYFEPTNTSMARYLQDYPIGKSDRIFFLVRVDGDFVGHIGLAEITPQSAEIDNLMRGRSGGHPALMHDVEETLVVWAHRHLGVNRFVLRVQSRNVLAKQIHVSLGFRIEKSLPLRRAVVGGQTILEPCSGAEATESFRMDFMSLEFSGCAQIP